MSTEKVGIDGLSSIVKAIAQVSNVFSKLLNKGGLFVLLGLEGPISVLSGVNYGSLKAEILDLSDAERLTLEKLLSDTLQLSNLLVDKGVDDFIVLAEATILTVEKDIQEGKEAYQTLEDLISKFRVFLGV